MAKSRIFGLILIIFLLSFSTVLADIKSISVVDDTIFDNKGKNWLIEWSSMYSDYVTASKTPSELKEETGYGAERGFTLKITSADEYTLYDFVYSRDVPEVEIREKTSWWGLSDEEISDFVSANCYDLDQDGIINYGRRVNMWGAVLGVYCFGKRSNIGTIYDITKKTEIFSVTWSFEPEGKSAETFVIDNDHNTEAGMSKKIDNKILIRWGGSFATGSHSPEYSGNKVAKSGNNYYVISKEKYDDWKMEINNDGQNLIIAYIDGKMTKEVAENIINNPAHNLFKWTSKNIEKDKVTFQASTFKYDLDESVYIPDFDVWIDGDYYVKIIVPKGEPKIISFDVPDVTEEGDVQATVKVKNIGDAVGDFEIQITCDKLTPAERTTYIRGIAPGEIKTKKIWLSAPSITKKESGTCSVMVTDLVSRLSDSDTDTYTINPRPKCDVPEVAKFINGRWCFYKCDPETQEYTILVKCCEKGETYYVDDKGIHHCKSAETPPTPTPEECDFGCEWWDIACKFREFMCKVQRFTWGILMFAGFGIGVLIIIWLVFKIISKKL
ncbi:MAG: hypothetical protein DRP09_16295 [Candidatus Thorarchaeota archaeon]|nr:MAG: hypothetical protein DRP09_16295 [Candidatus Thorarchaeota archaeon]